MKPDCKEIEQQLSESRREFWAADATINNLELKLAEMAEQLANTESKCAALAAENAWMKEYLVVEATPATDAFLAGVRAQCLNAFIQHHSAELDAHIKNGGDQFDEKSVRIRDIIVSARLFREQISKGGNQ